VKPDVFTAMCRSEEDKNVHIRKISLKACLKCSRTSELKLYYICHHTERGRFKWGSLDEFKPELARRQLLFGIFSLSPCFFFCSCPSLEKKTSRDEKEWRSLKMRGSGALQKPIQLVRLCFPAAKRVPTQWLGCSDWSGPGRWHLLWF